METMLLGIDEVGRGSWAGPLVVGAVVLGGATIEGLTDSKKLTKKQREALDLEIRNKASAIGIGWVDSDIIDQLGLSKALVLATKRAVEQITTPYHEIIIDGTVNFLENTNKGRYVTTMKKADLLIPCVSAASIVAKVARDKFMSSQDVKFRHYDFGCNVGYGTKSHNRSIEQNGLTPLHRRSFAPIKAYLNSQTADNQITTKQIGDAAEDETAKYLISNGHDILDRNWKTKYCEIDIVSRSGETIYFTEVKYRKNTAQGGGMATITDRKLRQMRFAAEYYILSKNIDNHILQLAAASLSGSSPILDDFLIIQ